MTTVGSRPAPTAPGRHAPLRGPRGPAFALTDQVLSSASNFLLGVIVARAGGAEALGTFGVAFLVWLAILGTSRALISEPMTVVGEPDASRTELGEGLAGSVLVGVAAAAVLGVAGLVLVLTGVGAGGLLALAPWLPSLLAQDYCRGAAFRVGRPDHALASDAAFFLVQAAVTVAVFATGVANLTWLLAAWGVGATVGTVVAMYLSEVRVVVAGAVARLRALWPRSRWFVAEFATAFPADQGYLLLLPLLLSTAEFGMYRAGASLVGPVVVLFVAGGNVGLPSAVRSLRDGGAAGLARFAPPAHRRGVRRDDRLLRTRRAAGRAAAAPRLRRGLRRRRDRDPDRRAAVRDLLAELRLGGGDQGRRPDAPALGRPPGQRRRLGRRGRPVHP
ncbi:MAG: hypothetical protein EKK42_08510 [Pseudonocardiaceae bacterium]|nr:MAG: hypothetical protein EKK42_08510 [Pseudonocardiaceae bacterium]